MAKGYDAHQQRQQQLSVFGKELARRSKSHCELSQRSGVSLHIYEVEPVPNEPDYEKCIFLCEDVIDVIRAPKSIVADEWRHLGELIWTDIPALQVMVYRILSYIGKDHVWAQNIIDEAYLDEEIIEWGDKAPLGKK